MLVKQKKKYFSVFILTVMSFFAANQVFAQFQTPCMSSHCASKSEDLRNLIIWLISILSLILILLGIYSAGKFLPRKNSEESIPSYTKANKFQSRFFQVLLLLLPLIIVALIYSLDNYFTITYGSRYLMTVFFFSALYYVLGFLWIIAYYFFRFAKRIRRSLFFQAIIIFLFVLSVALFYVNVLNLNFFHPLNYDWPYLIALFFLVINAIFFLIFKKKDAFESDKLLNQGLLSNSSFVVLTFLMITANTYFFISRNSLGGLAYITNNCSLAEKTDFISKRYKFGNLCYSKEAKEKKNPQICSHFIPLLKINEAYYSEDYIRCNSESVDKLHDLSFCNNLVDLKTKKHCVGSMHTFQADMNICNNVTPIEVRDYCKSLLIESKPEQTFCDGIENNQTRDHCYFSIVAREYVPEDIEICKKMNDSKQRDECLLGVVTHGNLDKSRCGNIQDPIIKEDCESYGIANPALIALFPNTDGIKDVSFCASISKELQINCLNYYEKNVSKITDHDCMSFPKFSKEQDYCLHLVDAQNKQISFCTNFLNDEFIRECKNGQLNW